MLVTSIGICTATSGRWSHGITVPLIRPPADTANPQQCLPHKHTHKSLSSETVKWTKSAKTQTTAQIKVRHSVYCGSNQAKFHSNNLNLLPIAAKTNQSWFVSVTAAWTSDTTQPSWQPEAVPVTPLLIAGPWPQRMPYQRHVCHRS